MPDETTVVRARPLIPLWLAVPLAGVAGVLMNLAFPSLAAWPLAFVALAMLLPALIGRRIGGAMLVSGVYGIALFSLLVSWTARYLGPVPWAALFVLQAALTAIALVPIALAYRWLPRAWPRAQSVVLPFVVAALWTLYELFLGNWPYGGFPWARLGMTQAEGPFAPVASWIGVSGLTFLMVAAVALLIEVVRMRAWRRPVRWIAPVLTVLVLAFTPLFPTATSGSMRIAAVQGNGTTGYFDDREPYGVITAQKKATDALRGEDVDLIVWPEGGVDYDPFRDEATARRLTRVVTTFDASLLANTATQRGDEYFNTSFLWTADGTATQTHDKRHPVPFGEYVPDREFYFALAPDLIGLVFQTNNADFRGTDENLQQLAFARMRAIETGRSVVNVSTVGTSQIIRPDGSTVSSLDADEAGALLEDVELRSGLTAGVVLGPWIQLGIFISGSLVLLVAGVLARRRR